jgi:group I intron endonuclease
MVFICYNRGMKYYTYAYLREDKTPYYIGKGSGMRAWNPHSGCSAHPPTDKSRIIILKYFPTKVKAYHHEEYLIAILGRKVDGGILNNQQMGGEGGGGHIPSEETRHKMSEAQYARHSLRSQEEKKAVSDKIWTEENRQRRCDQYSGEGNPFHGKTHTKTSREKMAERKRKPCVVRGLYFPSRSAAAEYYRVSRPTIQSWITKEEEPL